VRAAHLTRRRPACAFAKASAAERIYRPGEALAETDRATQYFGIEPRGRSVLGTPREPVIGLSEGETRGGRPARNDDLAGCLVNRNGGG
jgi:hypothetical protein